MTPKHICRTRAFSMENLSIDLQTAIWRMYHTENVIPNLPSHRELWNKKYTDDQLLQRVPCMHKYDIVSDQTRDLTMAIHMLNNIQNNKVTIGVSREDDASVRRGLMDYISAMREYQTLHDDERTIALILIREITYNLLHDEYSTK
jgi:hypothetical protein